MERRQRKTEHTKTQGLRVDPGMDIITEGAKEMIWVAYLRATAVVTGALSGAGREGHPSTRKAAWLTPAVAVELPAGAVPSSVAWQERAWHRQISAKTGCVRDGNRPAHRPWEWSAVEMMSVSSGSVCSMA